MQANFYNFSKKDNSTAIPSGGGVALNINLKDTTSIMTPVIELQSAPRLNFTYCNIPDFGRYYFIGDWSYTRGVWSAALTVDVAASHRGSILEYNAFVERSASNYDTRINDSMLSQAQEFDRFSTIVYPMDANEGRYSASGCFFVRIANHRGGSVGGFTTYVCTSAELTSMLQAALDRSKYGDWLTDELLSIFNPMEYILSVKWYPFSISYMLNHGELGIVNQVDYGWFVASIDTHVLLNNVIGCRMDSPEMNFNSRVYGDWRDFNSAYTDTTIYIPNVGIQTIDPMYLRDNIKVSLNVDYLTGEGTYFLYTTRNNNNYYISTFDTKVGIDVQITQLLANVGGAVSDVASAVGYAATGNVYGTAVGAVDAVKNVFKRTPSIKGNTGNILQYSALGKYTLTRRSVGTGEYPTTVAGRPLMKNVQLKTLSGYVKCGNASISIDGFESERASINAMLNSGIYIE